MKGISRKHLLRKVEKSAVERTETALHTFRNRMRFAIGLISFLFMILVARIIELNIYGSENIRTNILHNNVDFVLKRGDIVDRNGMILATNLTTSSLFVNSREIIDPKKSAFRLKQVLQDISLQDVEQKFASGKTFAWVKRHLTPDERQKVHDLGIPGLYFSKDEKRIYPMSRLFSHAVGVVDIDGNGIMGLEKKFDDHLNLSGDNMHVKLQTSLDARVQSIVYEELKKAVDLNQAAGGSAIVMSANGGEILSIVSLPDFDPHKIRKSTERQRFNQATLGVYEMGSTMKLATIASALEAGVVNMKDTFDVSSPLKLAKYSIRDYSQKDGELTVPEILMYSSNIGTAKVVGKLGNQLQKSYMRKLGMLSKTSVELPESSAPIVPKENRWGDLKMVTISYGYGLSITPLHVVKSIAAMVNGGILYEPTIIKQNKKPRGDRVLSEKTSDYMRKMMSLIVEYGGGRRAKVSGLYLGGKTGTSEVLVRGKYVKNANLGSFVGAFPIHSPQYVLIVLIDQAKPNDFNGKITLGGVVAAPVAASIAKKIAPLLGVWPTEQKENIDGLLKLDFTPSYKPLQKIRR